MVSSAYSTSPRTCSIRIETSPPNYGNRSGKLFPIRQDRVSLESLPPLRSPYFLISTFSILSLFFRYIYVLIDTYSTIPAELQSYNILPAHGLQHEGQNQDLVGRQVPLFAR